MNVYKAICPDYQIPVAFLESRGVVALFGSARSHRIWDNVLLVYDRLQGTSEFVR